MNAKSKTLQQLETEFLERYAVVAERNNLFDQTYFENSTSNAVCATPTDRVSSSV